MDPLPHTSTDEKLRIAKRVAVSSIVASCVLSAANIAVGLVGGSTSVVAAGVEFAGDVLASGFVLMGLFVASKPPDSNHPYGHGRFEILAGLTVGVILAAGGVGICFRSIQQIGAIHPPPALYSIWPLLGAITIRSAMSTMKFRVGRKIQSASLVADAWNDAVDILSALAALAALGLTIHDPSRFLTADHFGGFAVGIIVIFTGFRVMRDSSLELMDTMPHIEVIEKIRTVALSVPGVCGVEKCYARKTGLQYHVDLHLEVDPNITVWQSHELATQVRFLIREKLDWIADVLVHVEPSPRVDPVRTTQP